MPDAIPIAGYAIPVAGDATRVAGDARLVASDATPRVVGTRDVLRCASPVEGDAALEGRASPLREGIAAY
jgi:hypothetical protein